MSTYLSIVYLPPIFLIWWNVCSNLCLLFLVLLLSCISSLHMFDTSLYQIYILYIFYLHHFYHKIKKRNIPKTKGEILIFSYKTFTHHFFFFLLTIKIESVTIRTFKRWMKLAREALQQVCCVIPHRQGQALTADQSP